VKEGRPNKRMKLTPGELRSFAAYPQCSADNLESRVRHNGQVTRCLGYLVLAQGLLCSPAYAHPPSEYTAKIVQTPDGPLHLVLVTGDGIVFTDPVGLEVRNAAGKTLSATPPGRILIIWLYAVVLLSPLSLPLILLVIAAGMVASRIIRKRISPLAPQELGTTDEAIALVKGIYAAGAEHALAVEIDEYHDAGLRPLVGKGRVACSSLRVEGRA